MIFIFYTMILVGLLATFASLVAGLITMGRGGEFNRKHGNRFMRYRLIAQAGAVIGIVGVFWQNGSFGG